MIEVEDLFHVYYMTMTALSNDALVTSIQSEIQRVTDDLKGVDENLKRLTGRDFNEPRGERRTRLSSGGREDEPPPKRRPLGGVFARLGEPVTDIPRQRRVHEVSEEEGEILRHKPSVASSVARPVIDGKSRTEAAAELTKDKASRERNRRMFGALLGTLQRFRTEEAKQRGKDEQRAKIEKKLEEKGRAEKEKLQREKMDLISQRKERQARIKRLHFKMESVKKHEMWEEHQRKVHQFIRTKSKPHIFWMPKVLNPRTAHLISETKAAIERELEEARLRLKKELDEVLGGRHDDLPLREEDDDDDEEEMEEEKEREREGHHLDFNNGSDLLDYDAEEGELVYEDNLLSPGKKRERGQRVVVQVESSVNRAPQRRVELVTVVAGERKKRVREVEGSESEKENLLRSKVSVEYRNGEGGDGLEENRGRVRVKERERGKEREGETGKEREGEKKREREGVKVKERDKERPKERDRVKERVKEREKGERKRKENKAKEEKSHSDKGFMDPPLEPPPTVVVKKEPRGGKKAKVGGSSNAPLPPSPHQETRPAEPPPEEEEEPTELGPEPETWAEDLSHISLPIDPEPEPEPDPEEAEAEPHLDSSKKKLDAEAAPLSAPSMREVVVQHVPPGGEGGSMQVETVQLVLDTSAIKKDPGDGGDGELRGIPPLVMIKKEKDPSPPRGKRAPEAADDGGAGNRKASGSESSDSSSDSDEEEESSSNSEEEEEEEEESSSEQSSASSSSESEDKKKKERKEKEKQPGRKKRKVEESSSSSSSNSSSSSSSSDSDSGSDSDASSKAQPSKKQQHSRGRKPLSSPKSSRRSGGDKGSDKRRAVPGRRRSRSRSRSRNRSRSRDRRRGRSRSRDRRRGRK